ncbi:MAG: radical SAM protein [Candidatus Nanoarchaeia archaeon]
MVIKSASENKLKKSNKSYSKTKYYSYCKGSLTEGCAQCVKGKKMVLFITGLCPQRCFYCPVSEDKFSSDRVFANEWEIKDPKNPVEMIEECILTEASGCGITGGDPLVKLERTCAYIKLLKKEFGSSFHVHLYTTMALVTEKSMKTLYESGLDEIRFHPDLDNDKNWARLSLAKKFKWKIGVEIPVIPGYEEKTKKLMDFLEGKIEFLNLNELEFSDTDAAHYKLDKMNFKQKDSVSYGIRGSQELALKLMDYGKNKRYDIHFCTAKLKNMVQMGSRLKIRAKNSSKSFDKLTAEGFLYRGAAYLKGFEPGFNHQKKLMAKTKEDIVLLGKITRKLISSKILKTEDFELDLPRMRLLLSAKKIEKMSKELKVNGLIPALVTEYPTSDFFTLELEFL